MTFLHCIKKFLFVFVYCCRSNVILLQFFVVFEFNVHNNNDFLVASFFYVDFNEIFIVVCEKRCFLSKFFFFFFAMMFVFVS